MEFEAKKKQKEVKRKQLDMRRAQTVKEVWPILCSSAYQRAWSESSLFFE